MVGREDEWAVLQGLLEADGPLVVFVHGIAGVGKSTLVEAFAVEARDRGATVLHLDCRSIEPTERGFLAALGDANGAATSSTAEAATRLGQLGERVILVLDTYELLRLVDAWLRQTFVPALRDNVRMVLSGREPPMTGWESELGDCSVVCRSGGCNARRPRRFSAGRGSTQRTPNASIAWRAVTRCR